MPTLIVTGANSYVAGPAIQLALEKGYAVRGTVRSKASGEKLLATFHKYSEGDHPLLSYHIVADMTQVEAYQSVFSSDVTGVLHLASPFQLNPVDMVKDLLEPARDGAVTILEAAAKYGSSQKLQSVVAVSSFASVIDLSQGYRPGYVYTEKDWNPVSWEEGAATKDGAVAYCASKALAEKAMWQWMEEHKTSVGFTLTTITPPWVFGPYVDPSAAGITKIDQLNESMKALSKLVDGSLQDVPPVDFAGFVDVRDLAKALVTSYERSDKPDVAGQRFLLGSKFSYQTAADAIRKALPELRDLVPEGKTGTAEDTYTLDASKAKKALDIELTPLSVTAVDSARQISSLGK